MNINIGDKYEYFYEISTDLDKMKSYRFNEGTVFYRYKFKDNKDSWFSNTSNMYKNLILIEKGTINYLIY